MFDQHGHTNMTQQKHIDEVESQNMLLHSLLFQILHT